MQSSGFHVWHPAISLETSFSSQRGAKLHHKRCPNCKAELPVTRDASRGYSAKTRITSKIKSKIWKIGGIGGNYEGEEALQGGCKRTCKT
jgi:hypothetical protein